MRAVHYDAPDGMRCAQCHELIDGFVMTTDEVVEDLPEIITGVRGEARRTIIVGYLTIPCAHHRPPYMMFDGSRAADALL